MEKAKKRISPLLPPLLALLLVLAVTAGSVFAWFAVNDRVTPMKFQFARINSEVYFYAAADEGKNGVPDLLREGYAPAANEEEIHAAYYREAYFFNYLGKREAKTDTADEERIALLAGMGGMAPSEIYTFKCSLVNKGDSTNRVSVLLAGNTLTGGTANIRAALALRVCRMVNDGGDPAITPTVEVGAWQYLCDTAKTGADGVSFAELALFSGFDLPGMDRQVEAEKNGLVVNVCDLWVQVMLVPYAELAANEAFAGLGIDDAAYQAMQATGNAFSLDFSVLFEVDI